MKNGESMNILAFDTTLNKTYIALHGGETVAERVIETGDRNYHSAYLISAIKNIMQENDLKLQELDLIAVNHGPGSFTGIRVGVTVAKTLSKELGVNVLGVSSLDILQKAYEAPAKGDKNFVKPDVVLDARKENFYFKKNDANGAAPNATNSETQGNIELVPYSEIQNHISQNVVICDASSFLKLKTTFESHPGINIINFEEDNKNLALSLLNIAKATLEQYPKTDLSWHTLNPLYIQPPPIHKK